MDLMPQSFIHGDCHELLRRLPSRSFELIYADVPYGHKDSPLYWNVGLDWRQIWDQLLRLVTDEGAIVLHANEPLTSRLILAQEDLYRNKYTWKRPTCANFLWTGIRPLKFCEDVVVFSPRTHMTFNAQCTPSPGHMRQVAKTGRMVLGRKIQTTRMLYPEMGFERRPTDWLEIGFDPVLDGHKRLIETQKPVALCEYFILTYSNKGDRVLDFCSGSGTSAIACILTGRRYIGIEKHVRHFQIASERIAEYRNAEANHAGRDADYY